MKTAIAIALLAFTLAAPALAKDRKLTTQNKSIDTGIDEAGKKADSQARKVTLPTVNKEPREDRKTQRMSKEVD